MTTRPQTIRGVLGLMVWAVTVWVAGPVVINSRPFEWPRAAEGMLTGALFAIFLTATKYGRLPPDQRLPPAHAIGLGGFSLSLLAMMVIEGAARRDRIDAFLVVGSLLFALPGVYLIVAGIRQRRAEAKAAG